MVKLLLYFSELATGLGAGQAGVGGLYLAHRGAEFVAARADIGAELADGGVEGRAAEQEMGCGEAELGAVEQASDVLRLLLPSLLNDARGCIVADGVAVEAILRAIINLVL